MLSFRRRPTTSIIHRGKNLRGEGDEHELFHCCRHCAPVRLPGGGRSLQFGRTSAPILPHLVHTALASRSRSAVSSGQRSTSTTALWWHKPVEQWISNRRTPCERIWPRVTGGPLYRAGRRLAGRSSCGSG